MNGLQHYAIPEELKALAACFWTLANGGSLIAGRKVDLPLRPDPGVKIRFTAATLRTAADLPSAKNKEKAREIISHFAAVLGNSLAVHGAETAYNVAEVLQEEAGLKFSAGSVATAMTEFAAALATQRESEVLKCMKTIWK
ncbi:MAG: hypothetical protein ACR2FY_04735 [Pirellulaceae bacterium]